MKLKRKIASLLAFVMAFGAIATFVAPTELQAAAQVAAMRPRAVTAMQVSNSLSPHASGHRAIDADVDNIQGIGVQSIDLLIPASIFTAGTQEWHSFNINVSGAGVMDATARGDMQESPPGTTTLRPVLFPAGVDEEDLTSSPLNPTGAAAGFLRNASFGPGIEDEITGAFTDSTQAVNFMNDFLAANAPTAVAAYVVDTLDAAEITALATGVFLNAAQVSLFNDVLAMATSWSATGVPTPTFTGQHIADAGADSLIGGLGFTNLTALLAVLNNVTAAHVTSTAGVPTVTTVINAGHLTTFNATLTNTTLPGLLNTWVAAQTWTDGQTALTGAQAADLGALAGIFNIAATFGTIQGTHIERTGISGINQFPDGSNVGYTGRAAVGVPTAANHQPEEIPFIMNFNHGGGMQINVRRDHALNADSGAVLRVPLIFRVTGGGEITLHVTGGPMPNVNRNILLTEAAFGVNFTARGGAATGRDNVQLNPLRAEEAGIGAFSGTSIAVNSVTWIYSLPADYSWVLPGATNTGNSVWALAPHDTTTANARIDWINVWPGAHNPAHYTIHTQINPLTLAHELVIRWHNIPANRPAGQIELVNFRVVHRNLQQMRMDVDIPVTITRWNSASTAQENLNALPNDQARIDSVQNRTVSPGGQVGATATFPIVTLRDWGISLNRVGTAAVPELRAGQTFRTGFQANNVWPQQVADFASAAATIRIEELVPDSVWGARDLEFTLTDAEGNLLEGAKIAGVRLLSTAVLPGGGTSNTLANMGHGFPDTTNWGIGTVFHNRNSLTLGNHNSNGHRVPAANSDVPRGDVRTIFSQDGHSIQVLGLNVAQHNRARLDMQVYLSTDVNFSGPVYITMANRGIGHWDQDEFVTPSRTVHIANVNQHVTVASAPTNINIGFQQVPVQNIVITETVPGALRINHNVEVALTEFGQISARTEIGFNQIQLGQNSANVSITGHGTAQNRAIVSVLARAVGARDINLNVSRISTLEPSQITLHGLSIYASHAVPFGTYGLVVRGNAILDNDRDIINWWNAVNGHRTPTDENFRRYAFGGLAVDPYLNVVTPGQGPGQAATARIGVPHTPGTTFTVDGVVRNFMSGTGQTGNVLSSANVAATTIVNTVEVNPGRLFVPFRAVIEALGGTVQFFEGNMFAGIPHVVTATLSGVQATWTVGELTYTVGGVSRPMMSDGIAVRPFIGNGTVGSDGSLYLPLRYIAQAFNLPLAPNVNGTAVINPTAAELAGATQPIGQLNNGNGDNGNGNNGNGNDE